MSPDDEYDDYGPPPVPLELREAEHRRAVVREQRLLLESDEEPSDAALAALVSLIKDQSTE